MRKHLLLLVSLCAIYLQAVVAQTTIEVPVNSSTDDAEEYIFTPENDSYRTHGSMDITSSDIELGAESQDGKNPSIAGLRFTNLDIPAGAIILSAKIIFTVDATNKNENDANYFIHVEDNVNPVTFSEDSADITSRIWYADDSVAYSPDSASWSVVGETDNTTDISALVQYLVNKEGWTSGNSIAFFITGSGVREAESFDGSEEDAPTLVITYLPVNMAMAQINNSTDDAEEYIFTPENDSYRTHGSMDITSSDIELGAEEQNGKNPSIAGLRFTNIDIPAGAKIISSYIEFTVDATNKNENDANYFIHVEDVVNSVTFSEDSADITSRTWLDDSIAYSPDSTSWSVVGETGKTSDISALIQAIVNKETWNSGNPLTFFITGTGVREAESFDGSTDDAAKLVVKYIPVGEVTKKVAASSDDAEEYIFTPENDSYRTHGSMDVTSSDIELGAEEQNGKNPSIAGLRFTNLEIPANAVIESAKLKFTVDATNKNENEVSYYIHIEDNVNPVTFSEDSADITSRTWLNDSVAYSPDSASWSVVGESDYSTDISQLVQTIVNKEGWSTGNAMVFFITGTGVREAESFDGSAEDAPELIIEYLQGEIIYKPELVYEIPNQHLKTGWGLSLDVKPFFKDNDSELDFLATDYYGNALPAELSFNDGILSGTFDEARVQLVKIWAFSEGDTITDMFTASFEPVQTPLLTPLSTVKLGSFDEGAAEISAYDSASQRLFVTNAEFSTINIIDISDPANMQVVDTIDITTYGAGVNSIASYNGLFAAAIEANVKQDPGKVVVFNAFGNELWNVTVGALPDMVTFNNDGTKILVANEGEPDDDYLVDPEGSISIIDTTTKSVTTADFTAFNTDSATLIAEGVRIFGPGASVAKDMEPEYITVQGDTAYVSCQENNALAIVEISTATVLDIMPLGYKNHSTTGMGIDVPETDDIVISELPFMGMYMPDAIASYQVGGTTYVITANEGDSRDYDGYSEESEIGDIQLDPASFPNHEVIQKVASGLKISTALADTTASGEYKTLYTFGGRSFTIWNMTTKSIAYESGDQLEHITGALYPENFNASNTNFNFKNRSDDKGPEPEAVVLGEIDGTVYAFVGLERMGGIMVYDVTDPSDVSFVEYLNTRNFDAEDDESPEAGDSGPEGLIFVSADASPNGTPLLIVSNEISGTVTTYSIGEAIAPYTLAIFHNNDGESDLLADSITVKEIKTTGGSISQFKYTLDSLRTEAMSRGYQSVMLSSGDNFLAGLEYNASQANGIYYDAIALDSLDYDAIDLGNHDFDFGTDILAEFINAFDVNKAPYLSSNLGFENVPELQTLVDADRILKSTIVEKGGEEIGIIGLTTPLLPVISSPGNTTVSDAVIDSVQKQIDLLTAADVNKIILISHLQNLEEEKTLASKLVGIDVIIAGGGDELLSNDPEKGKPYNIDPVDSYPVVVQDSIGNNVYVVTTPGNYRYVGNLVLDFDAEGNVTRVYELSDLELVYGASDSGMYYAIEEPIINYIGALSTNVIAFAEDTLDFLRENLRHKETNGGNLFADALLWQAKETFATYGVNEPQIAIQNSGGLRIESIIKPGNFTEDLTYEIAAFTNILSVVEDITPTKFLELIEHGVASAPALDGRFPQIAGFQIIYDPAAPAGSRVIDIMLDDSTYIVKSGKVEEAAPSLNLATIDFTANGGDGYPFAPLTYKTLGATYQQAFLNYLTDELDSLITEEDYPLGMNERIIEQITQAPAVEFVLEDFNESCPEIPDGWVEYNSNADLISCGGGSDSYMEFNGYSVGDGQSWLITPRVAFDGTEYALSFLHTNQYSGPEAVVLYSTDYVGLGNPNEANWDTIPEATDIINSNGSGSLIESGEIDLSFITEEAHIAFQYTSLGTSGGQSTRLQIDNVAIEQPQPVIEYGIQTISAIQSDSIASPFDGGRIVTNGIVTAYFNGVEPYTGAGYNSDIKGFYIQSTVGDGNMMTSDGIFVESDSVVAVGDSIVLKAIVKEASGLTMLTNVDSLVIVSSSNPLPNVIEITLPLANAGEFEYYEGMLVSFVDTLVVTENRNVENSGEILLSLGDLLYQPTEVVDPNDANANDVTASGNSNIDAVNARFDLNAAMSFILDDARNSYYPSPIPYADENNNLVAGTSVTGVTGVLDYVLGTYKVQPIAAPVFNYKENEELMEANEKATLRVVAFNVYNYFNGDGMGGGFPTSRGAKTISEFTKQTQKIVATLVALDADVVGLIEIENDSTDKSAMNSLIDSLNAKLGSEIYDYINTGIVGRQDGTHDEIKNGFIYKKATVSPFGMYAILNDNVSTDYNDNYNRPAIAQTFEEIATGEKFTAVINHLKSKGSDCDDLGDSNDGDGQGECNVTRTKAAGTIASWLATDPTSSGDNDFVILGDLNAYLEEDPIDTLRSVGYQSLTWGDYSYVFDGMYGVLDHAMANESFAKQVIDAYNWHINSLSPDYFGYYGIDSLFAATPYRSSDHDPVVVDLQLGYVPVETITISGLLTISENAGTTQLTATILPADASDTTVTWLIDGDDLGATISENGLVTASGTIAGNGTITVIATSKDNELIFDEVDVVITNQGTVGIESITAEKAIKAFPIPSDGIVYFNQTITATVFNQLGMKVKDIQNASWTDLSDFDAGIYILKTKNGQNIKFVIK